MRRRTRALSSFAIIRVSISHTPGYKRATSESGLWCSTRRTRLAESLSTLQMHPSALRSFASSCARCLRVSPLIFGSELLGLLQEVVMQQPLRRRLAVELGHHLQQTQGKFIAPLRQHEVELVGRAVDFFRATRGFRAAPRVEVAALFQRIAMLLHAHVAHFQLGSRVRSPRVRRCA